jgi:hypothetical protein
VEKKKNQQIKFLNYLYMDNIKHITNILEPKKEKKIKPESLFIMEKKNKTKPQNNSKVIKRKKKKY